MKVNKSTLFPCVYHAIFKDGILLDRHVSESGNDVCDCLFLQGTAPRTILTSALLVFDESRPASLAERKAIKRWHLSQGLAKTKVSEPESDDFHIADASSDLPDDLDPSRTELDPTELAS